MVTQTSPSRIILIAAVLFVGGNVAAALFIPETATISVGGKPVRALTVVGNLLQCIVPLFANVGLLLNVGSKWRRNSFWLLLMMGCSMWLVGQLVWTYYEVVRGVEVPSHNDVIIFLHTVPLIGALAIRPHNPQAGSSLRYNTLDFALLMFWWVYLYAFAVIPWQYVQPDAVRYGASFNLLYTIENFVFVAGLGFFAWTTRGAWRLIYAHLLGAAALYTLGSAAVNFAIDLKIIFKGHAWEYNTGSLYDVPLVASFVWFGAAGLIAQRLLAEQQPEPEAPELPHAAAGSRWPARLAMAATLSMPLTAMWTFFDRQMPVAVRDFRLLLTFGAIVVFTGLLFWRQHLVDRDQMRLLGATHDALDNLRRLRHQFVQSERLASLGQVASGAAHEINNPLTAILGYTDLVIDDRTLPERTRAMLEKIREQARRTKTLVGNLLSFAQQAPADKSLTDINPIVSNAVQLRSLDLRGKNIRIHMQAETVLPAVQCDSQQMLQVFFHIINNAVDAVEETGVGGSITIRTLREKSNVVIEFSDTGAGIKNAAAVFDPFYTTKPVGKGSGLGLSICYGIVKEHGGNISCFNRPQGGATFRVELPAATAALPKGAPVAGDKWPVASSR